MRGSKGQFGVVIPMRPDAAVTARQQRAAMRRDINRLMPAGLSDELKAEWRRVATFLSAPTIQRLQPHYADTVEQYCITSLRLKALRAAMPTLNMEVYRVTTRNGDQVKSHPYVAQLNETWRQWARLTQMLGMAPSDDRVHSPEQGQLFDDDEQHFR